MILYCVILHELCSGDEDQAQERINKLAKILKEGPIRNVLSDAGIGAISCIMQRDEGRPPMRHSFLWKAEKVYYEEEPLLRHLEPPLSTFLELVCLFVFLFDLPEVHYVAF